MRRFIVLFVALTMLSMSAMAQDAVSNDADMVKRRELALEMHKIRPAREQVSEAVQQVARNLPPADQERFIAMVDKAFDYAALEKMSVDTMVNLFTTAELQAMVDYFGSPEAKAVAKKLPIYQEKLQPEIIRMLDQALADERFGINPTSAPAAPE
ncbi:hypothetical protein [Micavibrio aeruginosavorus]|uniref:hypothetical protein n=1 Tax=Micavibrio aeruginosavorus TaxID=349221 RepID=UPI003F4AC06A